MPKTSLPKLPRLPFGRPSSPPGSGDAATGAASDAQRRRMLLAASAAVVAAVLLVGYFLLGSSSPEPEPVASGGLSGLSVVTPSPSATPSGSSPLATDVNGVVARDPFQILYPEQGSVDPSGTGTGTGTGSGSGYQPGKGANTSSATSTASPTGTPTTTRTAPPPTTPPPTTPPPTTPPPTTPPPTTPPPNPTTHTSIALIGSPAATGSTYRATFQVDGKSVLTVNVGATMGGSLKFLSVHSTIQGVLYATVQYRTATPFDIAAGQTVRLSQVSR